MSARRVCSLASLLVTLAGARPALAYRPFDGTNADVAPTHQFELELGPAGYRQEGSERLWVSPAAVLNYGVAHGFELVLEGRDEWSLRHDGPGSHVEDVALSLKGLLREGSLQGGHGISVAVEGGLLLPGSEARLGAHLASIFSLRWPELALHLNLGNDFVTSLRYAASASIIAEGPDSWRVRPVAEAWCARQVAGGGVAPALAESLLVGAIARVSAKLSFDAALRYGHAAGQRLEEARLGLTWTVGGF